MAEDEVTSSQHAFMNIQEPPDVNLSLLSEPENLPDDVIVISPVTPSLASVPSLEKPQLWMETECEVSSNTGKNQESTGESFSVKDSDSIRETGPRFGVELIPPELGQRSKVKTHKCPECNKVFRTTNALKKHLLTHQLESSHVCHICQKEFKRLDHLTGHMLTHQMRKSYRCFYAGCQKMYCGYRSLKRHCATQHSTYPLPPSSQSYNLNTQPCPPNWEPPKLPTWHDGAMTSAEFHTHFPPLKKKSKSIFQFEGSTSHGTSYNNYTLATNFGSNPVSSQSWGLAEDGASHTLVGSVDLSSSVGGSALDQKPVEPEKKHTRKCNLDASVLQTWKGPPSFQPSKKVSGTGMGSQPCWACPSRNPSNLKQVPLESGEASYLKSNIVGSLAHQIEPIKPPLPPAPKTKKKRVKNKILTATNIPTPPLPSPRATTRRGPRPRPTYLVSPSQVAMASFSKESALYHPLKSTSQGERAMAMKGNGRQSGERTYLKYLPSRHAQFLPSRPQASTTSKKMDQQLKESTKQERRVDTADAWYQADQKVHLSPLVIPVSVPVSDKDASLNKDSGPTIEKQQNLEPMSKKYQHPGLLRTPNTPKLAAGCYPSQLRSPTYLADHLLNINPPPYTPPPMLSPLRPGTGLFFNTLPQPCLPAPSISSVSQDDKDGISLILDNTVVSIEPKINVGSRFQAEIPPLRNPLLVLYDEHPAELVWAPWGDLTTNPETQQKVTEFLDMCCSSVLPGGGTNTELALHCLHEVQGDILAALYLLLVQGDYRSSCHLLSDYHYTGSVQWTPQEMRVFQKVLHNQTKDFQLIHKTLQTKSVAQCVEHYYTMKKLKKFKQRSKGMENSVGSRKNSVGFI